jgi:hypothetical protein
MADFLIKNIPGEKMREFKTACAYFKQTMTQVFLDIIDVRINHHKADTGKLLADYDRAKKKEK